MQVLHDPAVPHPFTSLPPKFIHLISIPIRIEQVIGGWGSLPGAPAGPCWRGYSLIPCPPACRLELSSLGPEVASLWRCSTSPVRPSAAAASVRPLLLRPRGGVVSAPQAPRRPVEAGAASCCCGSRCRTPGGAAPSRLDPPGAPGAGDPSAHPLAWPQTPSARGRAGLTGPALGLAHAIRHQ